MLSPTMIYTLSLHDALPIFHARHRHGHAPPEADPTHESLSPDALGPPRARSDVPRAHHPQARYPHRSEEHTSELQSPCNLVCRLLLEKKKTTKESQYNINTR